MPRFKRYLDEQDGRPIDDVWTDIPPINSQAIERLGYPTQKPVALLERIIEASSDPGAIVLDAFCGCGTALVTAQTLKRQWIKSTFLLPPAASWQSDCAMTCGLKESEEQWRKGHGFIVRDLPRSEKELRRIPPFEFENWAVIAIGGIPNKAKVGDMGIDGRIFPVSSMPEKPGGLSEPSFDFMDVWYPIQVKQQDEAGRPDIDKFEAALTRENRAKGFFVSFDYTSEAMTMPKRC